MTAATCPVWPGCPWPSCSIASPRGPPRPGRECCRRCAARWPRRWSRWPPPSTSRRPATATASGPRRCAPGAGARRRDLRAYAPVLDAFALPAGDEQRPPGSLPLAPRPPIRPWRLRARPPSWPQLAAGLARRGNPQLTGDAVTAALIAEAACRPAVELVQLNLDADADGPALSPGPGAGPPGGDGAAARPCHPSYSRGGAV